MFVLPSGDGYSQLRNHPEDRGNDLPLRFSATLQCDYKSCQETVVVAGRGEEKETYKVGDRELYVDLIPQFVYPSPHLFKISNETPNTVVELIKSAFALSWHDYESCLNRIRVCLEILLDDLRIPKTIVKKGRRSFLSLHRRIELAQDKLPLSGPFLMAAKHLGNAGSHRGNITRQDMFDAFDLLEAIVNALYSEQKNVIRLAKKIVKNRGPIKRKIS